MPLCLTLHHPLAVISLVSAALFASAGASAQTASSLDAVQKAGVLRICTPGDYKPFSFQKPDGAFEGIDVDLMTGFSASLGAKPEWVKTTWANLLPDLAAGKCDIAVGGVSVTTDRQKRAFFSAPYMQTNTSARQNYPAGVPHEIHPEQYRSLPQMFDEAFARYADRPFSVCMHCPRSR